MAFALTVDLREEDAELAASLLFEVGATALEVRDSEALALPGVRVPAAGEAILVTGFASSEEAEAARAALVEAFPGAHVQAEALAEEDWSLTWRSRIRSVRVGRLWVGPPWETPPVGAVSVHIEPNMAFGTGDHPTTASCLESVDAYLRLHPGASVLDVGTGTGVLALAARKLGAGRVVGVDTDAVALRLARENAEANGVEGVDFRKASLAEVEGRFQLVVANILANTLVELAPALTAHVAQTLVVAGVLQPQGKEVARAYVAQGLHLSEASPSGEWLRLTFEGGMPP